MIKFAYNNWQIKLTENVAQQFDEQTIDVQFIGTFPVNYTDWQMYIKTGRNLDLVDLTAITGGYGCTLSREQLGFGGAYYIQLVGSYDDASDVHHARHSNKAEFIVGNSLDGDTTWNPLPQPFTDAMKINQDMVAEAYDNTETYAVGDYAIHGDYLYRCTTAVNPAEDFDITKWTVIIAMDEVVRLVSTTITDYYTKTEADTLLAGKISEPLIEGIEGYVLATDGAGTRYWKEDSGGGGGGGTTDYSALENKPQINSVTLVGNKSLSDLNIASATDLDNVEALIPAQATASNKLADKDFVNSSVSTNTAYFKGTYDVVDDLGLQHGATNEQIATALLSHVSSPTNNDYVFAVDVISYNTIYKRFKYNASTASWAFEFTLNNSSFTAEQWGSINSGVTSSKVFGYDNHIASTSNPHSVTYQQLGGTKPTYTANEVGARANTWNPALTDCTGILPMTNGGTGATSASDARASLGVSPVGWLYIDNTNYEIIVDSSATAGIAGKIIIVPES